MNKLISILAVMVVVLPLAVVVLYSSPDSVYEACIRFFQNLIGLATRLGDA